LGDSRAGRGGAAPLGRCFPAMHAWIWDGIDRIAGSSVLFNKREERDFGLGRKNAPTPTPTHTPAMLR